MLTLLFFQWCEARFLAEGIPCPGQITRTHKGDGIVLRLGAMNTVPEIMRIETDNSQISAVVEELD